MDKETILGGTIAGLGLMVFVPVVIAVMSIYNGIFIKLVYNMFIPTMYQLPEITLLQAIALALSVNIVFGSYKKEFKEHTEKAKQNIFGSLLRPVFIFLTALVIKRLMA